MILIMQINRKSLHRDCPTDRIKLFHKLHFIIEYPVGQGKLAFLDLNTNVEPRRKVKKVDLHNLPTVVKKSVFSSCNLLLHYKRNVIAGKRSIHRCLGVP